LEDLVFILR
jgi:hypothetical protein